MTLDDKSNITLYLRKCVGLYLATQESRFLSVKYNGAVLLNNAKHIDNSIQNDCSSKG
jgi:hypothetical protein